MRRDEEGDVKDHTALNVLLQSDGSIIFKVSLLYVDKFILKRYNDVKLLISYHDELQLEVPEHLAEEVGKKVVKCFEAAGKFLKVNCPISGEFKVGKNWSECH